MAQYKVPQDVEADDKLLGPFTFRQFVYLMVMGGFIGVAFALFQIFPLLALLAVPFIIFFAVLALPLKKDQPMETYLAAIVSYHLKPNRRFWNPGQRESTIEITAPKKVEQPRARDITEEEAGNRLSFLANVIDTEGYAVRGDINNAPLREQFLAEANATPDIMDANSSPVINQMLAKQQNSRHDELVNQMRQAINRAEAADAAVTENINRNLNVINPISSTPNTGASSPSNTKPAQPAQPNPALQAQLQNLANNNEYSIETISKEAARLENRGNEVFVSLH
ncbi:PrgI family protein [Candidatus Saccharibacteria bacterium]|nr:PrgI family protein [Candidatus Saccharibacteria bacterium]